jgi:predicted short-subunit dehydrogenase-like oxidoreductase (DUF2520 family)
MKIVILGTGNVASQLGAAFKEAKHSILQVYGRNARDAKELAKNLDSGFTTNLKEIDVYGEIYIIAVSDAAIAGVLKGLKLNKQLIAHTSGSISLNVFGNNFLNYGVFYPLQTISKNIPVNFRTTPICIESNIKSSEIMLMQLAKSISNEIHVVNTEQRSILHLAAVFANNFTNHLFNISSTILSENDLSFDLLKPLIFETANKLKDQSPAQIQTGPAIRGDKKTISRHLKMLKKYPGYKKIYNDITKSIQQIKK